MHPSFAWKKKGEKTALDLVIGHSQVALHLSEGRTVVFIKCSVLEAGDFLVAVMQHPVLINTRCGALTCVVNVRLPTRVDSFYTDCVYLHTFTWLLLVLLAL